MDIGAIWPPGVRATGRDAAGSARKMDAKAAREKKSEALGSPTA